MRLRAVSIFCSSMLVFCASVHADQSIELQRESFRAAYPDAELGIWSLSGDDEQQLKSYVLWPDLRAAYIRAGMRRFPDADIQVFLDQHGVLKPARELRYRYALHLASQDRLTDYMTIYRQYYQGLELPKLDCLALQAEIIEGHDKRVANLGSELWLVGNSQVDECDPVFEHLRDSGSLTTNLYLERFGLAISARNFTLARYLSKPLEDKYRNEASMWIKASNNLQAFLENHDQIEESNGNRERLLYAVERIAMRDPASALQHWRHMESDHPFSDSQRNDITRHLALWSARRHDPGAAKLLADLSEDAVDIEVLRWRVRTALRQQDWNSVVAGIDAMDTDQQQEEEWQYWLGIAQGKLGADYQSTTALQNLADSRSYYGFLAADELGADYAFAHEAMASDDEIIADLQSRDALVRARELFHVGLESRGRSEWDAAISFLNQAEMKQAAILAHSWGWHSRAIATAARTGSYDDLDLRYPTPWAETFERHASAAQVRQSWAYGVARSESLFMRDVRSQAGAIGLMQVMPETGRRTAKETNQPFAGVVTLVDPERNIQIGTTYLAKMYERFDNNQVLATAAYNAGPLNVEAWLPDASTIDARIWIENIPYNETRGYVRRVLATDAIFHWRLTGELRRISSELIGIQPDSDSGKVVQAN